MKKYFIYTCFAGMMLQACESDLEKAYYSGENSTPAVIEALSQEYVLDKFATDENVIEFKWTAPDLGYNASVSNNIEMDVKGNNFGDNKITLVSVKDKSTTASLSNKELNDQLETLLKKYEMPLGKTDIEFRISSVISDAVQGVSSNVISTSITPYDKSGRIAAVLNSLETEYDLSQNGGNIVLNWEEAYMGDNIKVTYSIEMNLEENVFSKRVILGKVVNETSFSIAYDKLNDAFIELLNSYGKSIDEAEVNFRIICEGSTTEGAISSDIAKTILIPSFTSFTLSGIEDVTLNNGGTLTLDWTDAEGIKNPMYNVELAMNGARKTISYGLTESTVELNHTALNKDILYMAESLASDMHVTFRVKASNAEGKMAIYSNEIEANVITFDIIPNEDYREIRGVYNNWGDRIEATGVTLPCQRLYKDGSGNYSGMIYITELYKGWKVKAKNEDKWWGAPKNEQQTNWGEKQLWTDWDAPEMTGYGQSSYNFSMTETGVLYMSNEEKSWYLSGDFNNWSRPSADQRLELKNDDTKYWLEDEAEMKAGQKWQIISEVRRMLVTPENIEGHFEKYDDSFFTVPEDGTYTIKWYFNEATPYLIVTKN